MPAPRSRVVPPREDHEGEVSFGSGGHTGAIGVLGGVAIAIGVPWVLLSQGQALGSNALLALVVTAVVCGAAVSLVSAFFGLVMPNRVHGGWAHPGHLRHLRDFAREAQGWERGPWGRRGAGRGRGDG